MVAIVNSLFQIFIKHGPFASFLDHQEICKFIRFESIIGKFHNDMEMKQKDTS